MSSRAHWQHDFAAALFDPACSEPPLPSAATASLPVDTVAAARRALALRIHRNNVTLSLAAALAAQYPVIRRLVGERFFGALARDYLRRHQPQTPSLAFYGDDLPGFIEAAPQCEGLPWLADVARLEFLYQRALHAQDEPVLDAAELACLDYSDLLRLRLLPVASAALLQSRWPVARIRDEHMKDEPGPIELAGSAPCLLLVYRRSLDVQIVTLMPPAHVLLSHLLQGTALLPAWERTAAALQLDVDSFAPLLGWLLQLGMFTRYELDEVQP